MDATKRKLIAAFYLNCASILALKRLQSKRKWWVRPAWTRRKTEGAYEKLVKALRLEDRSYFKKFLRVTPEEFDELKGLVAPHVRKFPAGRKALTVGHRLAITLRFLASGDSSSMVSIAFLFRIGISTTSMIVREVCDGLWKSLRKRVLPKPTEELWNQIAKGYEEKWNFPHCLGSVDGKHIKIQAPGNSGTMYFNYKNDFSIILMAVVAHEYRITVADVGSYGSNSDGGVWKNSTFGSDFDAGKVKVPPPCKVGEFHKSLPFVLVGDEGFQLRQNFMRPFPGSSLNNDRRIFNYRLSRARRCAENAFGIMANRWRILRRPINLKIQTTDKIVMACIVLHNYLMNQACAGNDSGYCPNCYADQVLANGVILDGQWRQETPEQRITRTAARNFSRSAEGIRNDFMSFFNTTGAVTWQAESAHIQ